MADPEINAAGAQRYYHALVSAYRAISKPATSAASPPKAEPPLAVPHEEDRQAILKELKTRINSLETQLRNTHAIGEAERQKLRRLEAKIDIFRARLETMQG